MAEILALFDHPIQDHFGTYRSRVVGREAPDGMWEGWIEFVPMGHGDLLVSGVESRQPEREHLVYWATGLTPVYLEGALARARSPLAIHLREAERPASSTPSPRRVIVRSRPSRPRPILDPFEVGARSLDILRQELGALGRPRLLQIIDSYDLNPARVDLTPMSDAQLAHYIVFAVDAQMAGTGERVRR